MISVYSLISAAIYFNFALVALYILRRNSPFIAKYGISALILLVILSLLRLLFPLDIEGSYIICSYKVLPAIRNFMTTPFDGAHLWSRPYVLLSAIWAIGFLIFLIKDLSDLRRFNLKVADYGTADDPRLAPIISELGIKAPVVSVNDLIIPYVSGLFKHTIYIPRHGIADGDLRYILLHENQHILSHDSLIKLIALIIRDVFWWNPITHMFLRELDALLELRCDARTTQNFSDAEKTEYLSSVLTVARSAVGLETPHPVPLNSLLGQHNDFRQRFDLILQPERKKSKTVRAVVFSVLVALFLLSYLIIVQPVFLPPEEEIEASYAVMDQDSHLVYENGQYFLYTTGLPTPVELPLSALDEPPFDEMEIIWKDELP